MPKLKPNFACSYRIPEGWATAEVKSYKLATSKQGNEMIIWSVIVTWPLEIVGCRVDHFTVLDGSGSGILKDFLKAINPGYDEKAEECFDPDDYLGKKLKVLLKPGIAPDGGPSPFPKIIKVERESAKPESKVEEKSYV